MTQRKDFLRAARGVRAHARAFALQAQRRDPAEAGPRLGLTVTRKVGTAVERNRIKRRLRAIVRLGALPVRPDTDYVIVARRAALQEPFATLTRDLHRAVGAANAKAERPVRA